MNAVVDANFFIAMLVEEHFSFAAKALVGQGLVAHVPYNCPAEVGQGLLKHHRRGFITATKAIDSFELFSEFPKTVHSAPRWFDPESFARCVKFSLSTGDYQYIFLAETLGLPVITADRGIIANAKSLVEIIDLRTL
jgi:predicted nucleic acid-binding protein